MKLDKLQRHTAYIIMLAESKDENTFFGFCYLINRVFGLWVYSETKKDSRSIRASFKLFPELYRRKPKLLVGDFWFTTKKEGWQKRIELLKQCIEETA